MVGTTTSAPLSGSKRADQAVDQGGIDLRHVAETDDGAVDVRRQRGDAGLERGAEPVGEMRIVHEPDRQAGKRRLDPLALMAGDHDDRPRPRGQRLLDDDADQRPAADLGEKLVRAAHAARPAGAEHDARRSGGRLCTGSSRGCGRVTISISRPPTPSPVISSRGTGRPARTA